MLYNYGTIKNPLVSKCFHSLMFHTSKIKISKRHNHIPTINNGRNRNCFQKRNGKIISMNADDVLLLLDGK